MGLEVHQDGVIRATSFCLISVGYHLEFHVAYTLLMRVSIFFIQMQ